MSREELGTLPAAAAAEPSPDVGSPSGRHGTHLPARTDTPSALPRAALPRLRVPRLRVPRLPVGHGPGARHRATGFALAVAVGVTAGWAADAAWRSALSTDSRLRTAGLSVVVVDAQHTGDAATRLTANLTVRLANLGLVPVQLIGSEVTYDAAAIVSLDPPRLTVPVNGIRAAVLEVTVGCRSPLSLQLPPLQARAPDGSLISVSADGAGQVLADLCNAGPDADHLVRVADVSRDGARLRMSVTTAGDRPTELQAIRAGGVRLGLGPLPATLDGGTRTIWLQPPGDCPLTWRRTGLPESIQLDIDVGAQATMTVPLGYALPAWLLDGPCRASPR